jgi:hypothetical protein
LLISASAAAYFYTDLIALHPDDARAYHERGWVYHLLARYDQARADYEVVPLTEDWQPYHYKFQAKDLAAWNKIKFGLGDRTGTVWIAGFTLTKGAR